MTDTPRTQDAATQERGLSTAAIAGAGNPTPAQPATNAQAADRPASLYSPEEAETLRRQWGNVQASFVDEPRRAVEQADNLVAVSLKHLAETFANERSTLESQWGRGDDVSTEDLRQVLLKYHAFFDRLLQI